ncbi:UDP-N-acetylglucosamine--N-acetylglucosamine transferase [Streptomyces sp. NPDC059708]|uniref:MGDG synthase family glycosyltransferase n=1 Tax=Streptomyces sp. NPDC059708 TaxID=3346916 RepID=UPI00367E6EC8
MPHLGGPADQRVAKPLLPHQRPGTGRSRVSIVSASIGAGHDGAAAELARRLMADGHTVDRLDLLDLLPARTGRAVGSLYHRLLDHAPWAYQRIYTGTEQAGGAGPAARALLRTARNRVLRALPADTGAVVSTYPGASHVLGGLRMAGELRIPALTYLTDFSVHPLWVARGIDRHLAVHEVPAAQARALGAAGVRVCGPVTDPRFRPPRDGERAAARREFGLRSGIRYALLVAGSWGVGPVRQVAAEIRACGAAVPVVVCGRNQALARRLAADGIEHVHGWMDDMPRLMWGCDVMVQNAGGLTSLEAFASALPVLSYRCIPGHGAANAAALDEAGVALWIRDAAGLPAALESLTEGGTGLRQRTSGLSLVPADPALGPAAAIADTCLPPARPPVTGLRRPPHASVEPRSPRRRSGVRLGTTFAAATAVWAGAVTTAVATGHDAPVLLRAVQHRIDPDARNTSHPAAVQKAGDLW